MLCYNKYWGETANSKNTYTLWITYCLSVAYFELCLRITYWWCRHCNVSLVYTAFHDNHLYANSTFASLKIPLWKKVHEIYDILFQFLLWFVFFLVSCCWAEMNDQLTRNYDTIDMYSGSPIKLIESYWWISCFLKIEYRNSIF